MKIINNIKKMNIRIIDSDDTKKRGEWKDKRCTECGESMWYIAIGNALATTYYQVKSNFCPNCGADMRKEGEC